jgi:hypothetical protein
MFPSKIAIDGQMTTDVRVYVLWGAQWNGAEMLNVEEDEQPGNAV